MVSFGLEQAGDYSGAERVARDGYTCPKAATDDIWLDHALVHSLYFQVTASRLCPLWCCSQGPNRQSDALQLFLDRHTSWDDHRESLCPFIYTHCFWHWALVLVEAGRFDEACESVAIDLMWICNRLCNSLIFIGCRILHGYEFQNHLTWDDH